MPVSTGPPADVSGKLDWGTARSFIPRFVLRRLADPRPLGVERHELCGALLLSDVEAFTLRVERLVQQGPEGLEQVITGFNDYFCAVADAVHRNGGDILGTAGDSFLCLWQAEDARHLADATALAAQTGLDIQAAVREAGTAQWPTRIGIAAGDLRLELMGGVAGRWHVIPSGPTIAAAVRCECDAKPGTVLLAPEAAAALRGRGRLRSVGGGRAEVQGLSEAPVPAADCQPGADEVPEDRVEPLIPAPVRRWGLADHAWLADFRRVTAVMTHVRSADDHATLDLDTQHRVVRAFQEVVLRFDGAGKAQFDSKGLTVSAVWGLPPRAHRDDVDRALQAAAELRGMLEDLGAHSAVGVSSGRVCCGVFGNDARREYTLFGDAVNLASRLSSVGVDEVLIDESTFETASMTLEVERRPILAVKNRREPVRVHRLVALRSSAAPEHDVVGRAAERAAIDEAVQRLAGSGEGSTIVIEGELGMGKSTLTRYATHVATEAGMKVLSVVAGPIERGTPYRPWRRLIASLLQAREPGQELAALLDYEGGSPAHLPLLNPFLAEPVPETPESLALTGEARSEQTTAILCHLVARAARSSRALLVVEDAQWLDSMSWTLLERVLREIPELMAVVTERTGEADAELGPERDRIRSDPRTRTLTLGPLSHEETSALVRQRLGASQIDPAILALVLERVTGHPFFCEALLDMMIQTGAIHVTGSGAELGAQPEVGVPASIESAILGQLDRLPTPEQLTLKAAAVVGPRFQALEVAAAHPADGGEVIRQQLDALREAGLIAPEAAAERFSFWHQIIQEVAYELLTVSQRQRMHTALARWYESRAAPGAEAGPELLAHHWMQAGQPRRAAPYLELAGRNALRAGAFREAVDLLVRAMDAEPDVDPRHRALQEKALADARYFLGDLQGSRALLEQSLERLGYPIGSGRLPMLRDLARGIGSQTAHLVAPRRFVGSRSGERETLLPAADAFRRLVQISYLHGNSSVELSCLIIRGLNLAELAGPTAELARALANVSTLAALSGLQRRADAYARRATALVEDETNSPAAAYVWNIVSIMHASRGWWDVALKDNGRALELFGEIGDTRLESELWQTRAAIHLCCGSLAGAETAWRRHRTLAEQTGSSVNLCWSLLDEAQTAFHRGDVDACAAATEAALEIPVFDSDGGTALERRTTTALARLAQGNHAEAASHAHAAVVMLSRSLPSGFHWGEFGALAVEVLLELRTAGSRTVPQRSLDRGIRRGLFMLRRCAFTFGGLGPRVPLLRARAALLAGDRGRAARLAATAHRLAARGDQRLDRARAAILQAELHDEPQRRTALLAEPIRVLDELGHLRQLRRAQELIE